MLTSAEISYRLSGARQTMLSYKYQLEGTQENLAKFKEIEIENADIKDDIDEIIDDINRKLQGLIDELSNAGIQ